MIKNVIIDSKEPKWVQELDFGAPISINSLTAGDVWLNTDSGIVIIERKTAGDLLNSITDNRATNQSHKMRQISPYSYVVITDQIHPAKDGKTLIYEDGKWVRREWYYNAIQGQILTIQELGIHVIYAAGENDFLSCCIRLAGRSREPVVIAPRRESYVLNPSEVFLSSLPNIGVKKAKELLETFPNVSTALYWLTNLDDKGLEKVAGIGKKTKEKILNALGEPIELGLKV